MNHLEEIKLRLSIEELVGSYVQLKKAGRNLKGNCPFHSEKTPSFVVSPEKGIAYCFGCNKGGDIFKFVELIENVPFPEAVSILAQKTNVKLPQNRPQLSNKRLKGIEINQATVKFYQEKLNPVAKDYFVKRGLSDETINHFKLGFAPDSFDQLKNHLGKEGFAQKDLIEAAVVSQRNIADQNTYDRFRNRLIFPIFDHQGNPVGFSGRIMGEGEPKYLNSPETPSYNKSLILYGLNWAKESIKQENLAIFTEGYMDVIASHQAGVKNVVATCGTALTPQQLKLIARYTKNIAFAFDQDAAGMEATFRAIELAELSNLHIGIIIVPNGKDPDDCIQEDPKLWEEAIQKRISVMDFYFAYILRKESPDTIEGKRAILDFLLPIIKLYKSEVEQSIYLNRLAIEIKTDIKLLWNDLKRTSQKKRFEPKNNNQNEGMAPKAKQNRSKEEFLLALLFKYPQLYEKVSASLIDNIPFDEGTKRFYTALKKVYTNASSIDLIQVKNELEEDDRDKIDIFGLLAEEHYPDFPEDHAEKEVEKLTREINRSNLYKVQKEFEVKIRIAESQEDKKVLLNRYNELLKLSMKL